MKQLEIGEVIANDLQVQRHYMLLEFSHCPTLSWPYKSCRWKLNQWVSR